MGGASSGQANSSGAYDLSKMSQDTMSSQGGMSFINASGSGGSTGSLLAQSPFGPLLSLPGVTADNLFSIVNPSSYSNVNLSALGGGGSSTDSGSIPPGGNPFASIGSPSSSSMVGSLGASSNPFA